MKPIEPAKFPWKDYQRYTYPLGLDLGPLAFLSGHTASAYDAALDKVVSSGDLRAQTLTAMEKMRVILQSAGYAPQDVVSLIQYVTPAALDKLQELQQLLASHGFGAAVAHVVPVTRLLRRDALVELEAIAARPSQRAADAIGSGAIRVHRGECDVAFTAGIHSPAPGDSVAASLTAQVRALGAALKASQRDWSDVARCRLLLASARPAEVEAAAALVRSLVPELPAVPAVGVAALPPASAPARFAVELCASNAAVAAPACTAGALVRRAGPFLVATGLRSGSEDGNVADQATRIYGEVLPRLLEASGIGIDCIVQTVEWLTEDALRDYKHVGPIRRQMLREPFPVASGLVCSALPGSAKLAVDVVAFDRDKASGGI